MFRLKPKLLSKHQFVASTLTHVRTLATAIMVVFGSGKAFAAGAICVASLVLSSHGSEESHAPFPGSGRALQASSNIVFINAAAGTAFTSAEEDAVQLQVLPWKFKIPSTI